MNILFLLIFSLCMSFSAFAETDKDFEKLSSSTLILYTQGVTGGMEMRCTATLFDFVPPDNYKLITAGHCVVDVLEDNKMIVTKTPLFVSADEDNDKGFVRTTIEKVGKINNGYDVAVLSAKTERVLTTVEIGDERLSKDGDAILNVAVPGGLGKTCFRGYISHLIVDRPLRQPGGLIDWSGTMLLQLPLSPGSSGSAIFSPAQNKIIGVLVGSVDGHAIAIPISRLSNTDKDNWMDIKAVK